jgi:hypothetical protein
MPGAGMSEGHFDGRFERSRRSCRAHALRGSAKTAAITDSGKVQRGRLYRLGVAHETPTPCSAMRRDVLGSQRRSNANGTSHRFCASPPPRTPERGGGS